MQGHTGLGFHSMPLWLPRPAFPLPSQLLFAKGAEGPRRGPMWLTCKHQEEPWLSHLVEDSYHPDCKQLLFLLHSPASLAPLRWLPAQSPGQHILEKYTFLRANGHHLHQWMAPHPTWRSHSCRLKLGAQMAPPWKDAHWKVWFPSQRTMGRGQLVFSSFNWSEDIHFLCWHPMLGRAGRGKRGAKRGTEVQSRGR